MNIKFFVTAAATGLLLFAGCNIFITIPETTITAQNDLVNVTSDISGINLRNVTIGDVSFSAINAGTITDAVTTEMSGNVDIEIGSATASVVTSLGTVSIPINDIDLMETYINEGEDNTVVFDKTTAAALLSSVKIVNTTIVAKNTLEDLTVTVNGHSSDVQTVDLQNVLIGDVNFSLIKAGTTTQPQVTNKSGSVNIQIGSATATVTTTLGNVPVTFSDIDPMVTTIVKSQENTVIFDETTASAVFSALAKKMVK